MITVNARLFKAASLFVSGEDTRYYIQGVCIEPHPEGALLVATDGRRLVAILDRKGSAERKAIIRLPRHMEGALVEDVMIDDDDDEDEADVTRQRCDDRTLSVLDGGIAQIDLPDGGFRTLESCEIKGKFPAWRKECCCSRRRSRCRRHSRAALSPISRVLPICSAIASTR